MNGTSNPVKSIGPAHAVDKLGHILGELPVTAADFVKRIHPEDHERFSETVRNHLKQGDPYLEEYRMIGKDGNIIHLRTAGMGLRNKDREGS